MKGAAAILIVVASLGWPVPQAQAQTGDHSIVVAPAVPQALDMLTRFGYVVNTPARAQRAIRHWQKVNGLVVDGIAGPQTLASLTAASAGAQAQRVTPPAPADVEGLIRALWPDDSEDQAVRIARRESRLQPGARNSCCFGLFQIHWQAHRGWLTEMGITSSSMLLDAGNNIAAALALYQAAGWAPWAL